VAETVEKAYTLLSTKRLQLKQKTASKPKPPLPSLAATEKTILLYTSKSNDHCYDSRTNYDD